MLITPVRPFTPAQAVGLANPILTLDNIVNYTEFWDDSKITESMGNVTAVARSAGTVDFTCTGNLSVATSGGLKGINMDNANSSLDYSAAQLSEKTMLGLFYLPTYVGSSWIMNMNDRNNAGVNRDGATRVQYYLNQAGGVETISLTANGDEPIAMGIQQRSSSDMSMFWNAATPVFTIDPNDQLTTQNVRSLGQRTTNDGVPDVVWCEWLEVSDALSDAAVVNIFKYWQAKHGVVLL